MSLQSIATTLSLIAVFLFLMFDNYVFGIRPFDILGFGLVLFLIAMHFAMVGPRFRVSRAGTVTVLLTFGFVAISVIRNPSEITAHAALIIGVIIFFYFQSCVVITDTFRKGINFLLGIAVFAIFLQLGIYALTHFYVDLIPFKDSSLRVLSGGIILRCSGFYMEPNTHCLAVAMLMLLRRHLYRVPFNTLSYLGLLSMVISLSLWGMLIALVLLLENAIFYHKKFWVIAIISITVGGLGYGAFTWGMAMDNPVKKLFVNRIIKLSMTDKSESKNTPVEGSYRDRYQKLFEPSEAGTRTGIWFGNGYNTKKFQDFAGANGISLVWYTLGIGGAASLFGIITYCAERKRETLFAILISLVSFPLVAYGFWWVFLGLLYSQKKIWEPTAE